MVFIYSNHRPDAPQLVCKLVLLPEGRLDRRRNKHGPNDDDALDRISLYLAHDFQRSRPQNCARKRRFSGAIGSLLPDNYLAEVSGNPAWDLFGLGATMCWPCLWSSPPSCKTCWTNKRGAPGQWLLRLQWLYFYYWVLKDTHMTIGAGERVKKQLYCRRKAKCYLR